MVVVGGTGTGGRAVPFVRISLRGADLLLGRQEPER